MLNIAPEISREHFTPLHVVKEMCSHLEPGISNTEKKFFEPSCGEGVFLVEVVERRMKKYARRLHSKNKILRTIAMVDLVKNIYAFDVVPEFVEVTKARLLKKVSSNLTRKNFSTTEIENFENFLMFIISSNVVCFDFLSADSHEEILLNEWNWKTQTKLNYVSYTLSDIVCAKDISHISIPKSIGHYDIQKVLNG